MARKEVYAGNNKWFSGVMKLALRDKQESGAIYQRGIEPSGWEYVKVWLENFNALNPAKKNQSNHDILIKYMVVRRQFVCKCYIPGFDVLTCYPTDDVFKTICQIVDRDPSAEFKCYKSEVKKSAGRGSR
jgi:hypothetical protein